MKLLLTGTEPNQTKPTRPSSNLMISLAIENSNIQSMHIELKTILTSTKTKHHHKSTTIHFQTHHGFTNTSKMW